MAALRGDDASGDVNLNWQFIDDGILSGVNACNMPRAAPSRSAPSGAFDFNSTQPNPWHIREEARPDDSYVPEPPREPELQTQKFASCCDPSLFAYLNMRNVSIGFLHEIDQFMESHPEIASCSTGREMIRLMNNLSPLEAYRYFIKGYTRPARYVDGIVVSGDFRLPVGFRPPSLRSRHDPELDDFFEGFDYRWDIIDRIDREVMFACNEISSGKSVPSGLRRLVCYAAWGNPVDAYKWFEYNYQEEYMAHRYLPEHVVLSDIPKPQDYTLPNPRGVDETRTHMYVRFRMARANDEGVDVLEVLLSEYRSALVKKGFRRKQIDEYCERAKGRLDAERESPTGVDIVNLIMDDMPRTSFSRPTAHRARRFHVWTSASGSTRIRGTRNQAASKFVTPQAAELGRAKRNLEQLYTMEEQAFLTAYMRRPEDIFAISSCRQCAERRYVNALIRYMRDSNQMTAAEATDLQRYFTRQKMEGMGPINKTYLLGMYPRELH
ncbi:hypothetical protein BU23DRAFT_571114 [Bimuria novae-zelandiae CBS 107.79]|uniref:Uncharacterized protein n=1 Tax=Bimuria novae-zelandiae CBS 107.79 TaxID=1447943 RepID=A0A6A5UY23_9PLEO|nr:hypothetical protein BU23DRAFT_571114 [Bimuria novae-zelandiae CBS 107.79]